jgi:putative endonuclease
MEYVYILRSEKDRKLYIGLTNNFVRRFEEHNAGQVSSTKGRKPLKVVYIEEYSDRKQAAEREKFFLNQEKDENFSKKL